MLAKKIIALWGKKLTKKQSPCHSDNIQILHPNTVIMKQSSVTIMKNIMNIL